MLFLSAFILLVCEFCCAAIGVLRFQDKSDSKTVQVCIFALRLGSTFPCCIIALSCCFSFSNKVASRCFVKSVVGSYICTFLNSVIQHTVLKQCDLVVTAFK